MSDLVNGVRALFDEVRLLTSEKSCVSVGVAIVWQFGCWECIFSRLLSLCFDSL